MIEVKCYTLVQPNARICFLTETGSNLKPVTTDRCNELVLLVDAIQFVSSGKEMKVETLSPLLG